MRCFSPFPIQQLKLLAHFSVSQISVYAQARHLPLPLPRWVVRLPSCHCSHRRRHNLRWTRRHHFFKKTFKKTRRKGTPQVLEKKPWVARGALLPMGGEGRVRIAGISAPSPTIQRGDRRFESLPCAEKGKKYCPSRPLLLRERGRRVAPLAGRSHRARAWLRPRSLPFPASPTPTHLNLEVRQAESGPEERAEVSDGRHFPPGAELAQGARLRGRPGGAGRRRRALRSSDRG